MHWGPYIGLAAVLILGACDESRAPAGGDSVGKDTAIRKGIAEFFEGDGGFVGAYSRAARSSNFDYNECVILYLSGAVSEELELVSLDVYWIGDTLESTDLVAFMADGETEFTYEMDEFEYTDEFDVVIDRYTGQGRVMIPIEQWRQIAAAGTIELGFEGRRMTTFRIEEDGEEVVRAESEYFQ